MYSEFSEHKFRLRFIEGKSAHNTTDNQRKSFPVEEK
nr:MAG TPA: hypothetical protein [Caudoviricetes sp.]